MTGRTRREFLSQAAGAGVALAGAGSLLGAPASEAQWWRPPPPRAHPPRHEPLRPDETRTLAAWCDRLAPGAASAGVGAFVNAQLVKHPDDALLGIRYFGWPPPWDVFYRDTVEGLDAAAREAFDRAFAALSADEQDDVHQRLLTGAVAWSAPAPFFLCYLVARSDAVDVVYGTPNGYRELDMPYVPQVRPRSPW